MFLKQGAVAARRRPRKFVGIRNDPEVTAAPSQPPLEDQPAVALEQPAGLFRPPRVEDDRLRHRRDGTEGLVLDPLVLEPERGMGRLREGPAAVQPELEPLEPVEERQGSEVFAEGLAVGPEREGLDPVEDARRGAEPDAVRPVVFLGPARESDVDLDQPGPAGVVDEDIQAKVHGPSGPRGRAQDAASVPVTSLSGS